MTIYKAYAFSLLPRATPQTTLAVEVELVYIYLNSRVNIGEISFDNIY